MEMGLNVRQRDGSGSAGASYRRVIGQPALWQVVSVLGVVTAFAGLAVDAWRHNSGGGEETLLSLSNPGHAIAGAGLAMAAAGSLIALSLSLIRLDDVVGAAMRRLAGVAVAWLAVSVAAVGAITYIAASGTTVGHSHADGEAHAAGDAHADGSTHASLAGADGAHALHPAGEHDHGPHPSFDEILRDADADLVGRFPAGTITADDLPLLRAQLRQASEAASRLDSVAAAVAAGYVQITTDVDYMGIHYLNIEHVTDERFDPSRPEGLLFSRVEGSEPTLVGVWYLQVPGVGNVVHDVEPDGFAGRLDYWHGHQNVCMPFETEGETEEACAAKGGRFVVDSRWMMHAWVVPGGASNPDGVFAYLNPRLLEMQLAYHGGTPDSDDDGLTDDLELRFGQDPIVADTDGDGLRDGVETAWLRAAIEQLPEGAFASTDAQRRDGLVAMIDAIDARLAAGDVETAAADLLALRDALAACDGPAAPTFMDGCARRIETSRFADQLIRNLGL